MYHLIFLSLITSAFGLTEVILTRNQFNDFVAEMEKISNDISIEDANITLDLSNIEQLIGDQNNRLDTMLTTLAAIQNSNLQIAEALQAQTDAQLNQYNDWYTKFESFMNPITQVLTSLNNAIGIIKDLVTAIQSIFDAFQGTQDAAVSAIETNVEIIASNFELGMKAIVTEAIAGSSMTFTALECVATELDACESVLGEGPIICEGAEFEVCEAEGLVLEPVFKMLKGRKPEVEIEEEKDEL